MIARILNVTPTVTRRNFLRLSAVMTAVAGSLALVGCATSDRRRDDTVFFTDGTGFTR